MRTHIHIRTGWTAVLLALIFGALCFSVFAADSSPRVTLNVSKASPRQVEPLTQNAILRDYKFAWASMEVALQSNSLSSVNGLFVGEAGAHLSAEVKNQQQNDVSLRYGNQSHKLEAVFYSPEGDIVELHDTAEYDFEILASGKSIHSEHAVVHYIVLMTPGADRWVVRHLQAVPQF
jgi:hypothetical protein